MQNKKLFTLLALALLFAVASPTLAAKKFRLAKAVITKVDGFTITATKNNHTYTINAQRAVLQNAKKKRTTIDQFFAGDQIDIKGNYDSAKNIIAKKIKDRSLKPEEFTRRSVGAENLKDEAIISYSKLNLANSITGFDLAPDLTISTTGDITANNLTASGQLNVNGTGNNYFAGNVGIGTTNPGARVHARDTAGTGVQISVLELTDTSSGVGNGAAIDFSYANTNILNAEIGALSVNGEGGALTFSMAASDGAVASEYMRGLSPSNNLIEN